jgi:restriction system protein
MYKSRLFFFKTKAIVQCKRYANTYVGVSVVREMYGLKYEYGVDEVYIVTTSGFTKDSYDFAKNKKIFLININELIKLINNIV